MTCLVVSAYYKIPNKQSHEWYMNHLNIFFTQLKHLTKIFFCSKDVHDELHEKFVIENTIFYILEFSQLPILKKYSSDVWKTMLEYDVEKYHTKELGIIWSSKKEFLNLAKLNNPNYDWYIWVDAGCIRSDKWKICTELFTYRIHDLYLQPGVYLQGLNTLIHKPIYQYPDQYIAGAIIVAHNSYINTFVNSYDNILDMYIDSKISITSDQYILASLYTSEYNDGWLHIIQYDNIPNIIKLNCPDHWFFFLSIL